MKKIYSILTLCALFLLVQRSNAQQEIMVSQYMFNPLFINPAYAGAHKYNTAMLLYRGQWTNFKGSPVSQIASVDGKLKEKNVGLGLTILNDHIGVSDRTELYGNYSYHLKAGSKATLAMGLNAGVAWYRAKLTSLTVWDAGDNAFTTDITSKVMPNFGSGLYFFTEDFYAGFSVPNLLQYKPRTFISAEISKAPQFIRHYYFHTGYALKINDNITLKPSVLLKYVEAAPLEADFTINVMLKSLVTVGASFRTGDSFIGLVEFNLMKNLRLGYAYDYSFTDIRHYNNGSHEIRIAYDFGKEALSSNTPSFIN